ncbi:MAG: leucyl/phenylalanyl-tRNA--protein transferase [Desulfonatronovibrionaceae bacterium]
MTVFYLGTDPVFPPPEMAEPDGLLAVGGDLSEKRLLAAYAQGIFPWYCEDTPILWWCLSPRPLLFPPELHIPKSLRRVLNSGRFRITFDSAFKQVICGCARVRRPEGEGTWIRPEMIRAYEQLHKSGYAHSVETWEGGELVGGLYGVSMGRAFFGESMFHLRPNASKAAFVHLVRALHKWGFHFLDCQQTTAHVIRFGAQEVELGAFKDYLKRALQYPDFRGVWINPAFRGGESKK